MKTITENKLSRAQETALLKKYLKQRFGVVVKIRKQFYSMGCSLDIDYALGCAPDRVENIVNALQYGSFDGMTDMYNNYDSAQVGLKIDGYDLEDFKYVSVNRAIPNNLLFEIARAISAVAKFEDIHECNNEDDYKRDFKFNFCGAWNWANIAYHNAEKLNFCTQNAEDVKIIEAYQLDDGRVLRNYHFVYEVAGQQYDTATFEEQKPKLKKSSQAEKNDIRVVDYSDLAIAVYGNTYEIRESLKSLGGRFNRNLKEGAGWIFSKSKMNEISDLIINYHEITK